MSEEVKTEKVDLEDILLLRELKHNYVAASLKGKINELEKQNSELLYDNSLIKIYLKYGLTTNDSINQSTGEIILGGEDDKSTENESDEGVS